MSNSSSGAIVGGAVGALALVAIVVGFVWFCKTQCDKHLSNKNSETGSSDPSAGKNLCHILVSVFAKFVNG